jgi:hypothetical protein
VDRETWYADADADGYGDEGTSVLACVPPRGYGATTGDCDDANVAVNPEALEICNGIDDDCDGIVDPATSTDARTWYVDADGDGFGDPAAAYEACEPAPGDVRDDTDCDDTDADTHPGAREYPDGEDDDCDGRPDNGLDSDGDGLYDDEEIVDYGTDPYDRDSDGDGVDDKTEVDRGTDPNDPGDETDTGADTDSDTDTDTAGGDSSTDTEDTGGPGPDSRLADLAPSAEGGFYGGACACGAPGVTSAGVGGWLAVAVLAWRGRRHR